MSASRVTRANADCSALYALIWTNVTNTWAPVTGGRGASAVADFAAHKPMALTKQLGRAIGIAGTGASLTLRALGETLGEQTHVLTIPEMPAHAHNLIVDSAGGAQTGALQAGIGNNPTNEATSSVGGGLGHNVMQPTSFWNIMIKL